MEESAGRERVVRAERFEVVDRRGRVRVVVGLLDDPDPEGVFGVELRDRHDQPRATLGLSGGGPWLVFELDGNLLVHMGVNDPGPDTVEAGAFLYLADRDGRPVVGWHAPERSEDERRDADRAPDPGPDRGPDRSGDEHEGGD